MMKLCAEELISTRISAVNLKLRSLSTKLIMEVSNKTTISNINKRTITINQVTTMKVTIIMIIVSNKIINNSNNNNGPTLMKESSLIHKMLEEGDSTLVE